MTITIFLYAYFVFLFVWFIFSMISIFHATRISSVSLGTILATLIYIVVAVGIMGISYNYLNQIDWTIGLPEIYTTYSI